ncbi:hypothetical protein B0T26DRAFT_454730 [Lasiosphaeria miniovina]|uniref:Gem-associated protein 5 TPR domain-containing protein n=1 Tax=Lasiosphaeria miniovina TaxID=1954250 RepID=A0AA40DMN2_9PEZI|nr:uncharacterized protein B0T26DRAFT_454730 [Lasiosphaeria miniovina]KAK0706447.1 hypothetical protein B0T26DRAFT_454730 [Lasiosphaeria miniovina]
MSTHLARSRAGSKNSALEAPYKGRTMNDFAMPPTTKDATQLLEPCAATASMFLYAQGSSVVCSHHDTLTIERRFARHSEEVQLLAVDNQSDVGAGRLVVSYDAGQTAIVWDLVTGDEVARFASYENLTCAAWMRNGNVAFGNTQGGVILFEPTTSEHISARTIDQISITAIAPATDCRTFAIGYKNGSLLIATLQPKFTILHNLSTSRGPSPIVTLAWHASSSRQKSDMLAVQTHDGDLRVWSVSKSYNSDDPAKVVRILKKSENYLPGPNWMGWSKNGRIIQYSESETISWDVRTKHVTYDGIPTLENIRGLAVYGPGASLFTLGANNTVQQFDLNSPAMMVANVQHPANLLPPSPPISLEAEDKGQTSSTSMSESETSSVPIAIQADLSSESGEDRMSPLARLVHSENDSDQGDYRVGSPMSSRSRSSVSISSSTSQVQARNYSRSVKTENTYISAGSSLRSSAIPHNDRKGRESYSTASSQSLASSQPQPPPQSQHRSRHNRPSRLRHEVPRSPADSKVVDLFKFTKSRLTDVPFKAPFTNDSSRLTNDDLRRQMLTMIFGWNKDADELVRDEMSRHPLGSTNRILLAKWLGDISTDIMAMGSENMTSSDWMLLALSGIGGMASQHKLGRAYVQRLLESGDVHAAATIMIGLGDHNDAIEIYISHKRYMEALLLTCLFFPSTWERQESIIRKWGEWAVQHGQQQLAIRCFACTGRESSDPWTSPSAQQVTFPNISQNVPEILSPPMSPPHVNHGPQRSIAKSSALKLITSFGDPLAKSKFFSGQDDGKTPIAAGATPIAESALSPGGLDPATAVLRAGNRSQFATPSSARPIHGFGRQRLPSIGETPDATHQRELLATATKSHKLSNNPYGAIKTRESNENTTRGLELARAATASPRLQMKEARRGQPPPSPSPAAVAALMEGPRMRNGSRHRIPEGLDLSLPSFDDSLPEDLTSPDQSGASNRYHWPTRRRAGPGSVASSVTASSVTSGASSLVVPRNARGNQQQGKSLDDYIHSLDAVQGKRVGRGTSRESRSRGRDRSRSRRAEGEDSRDHGRTTSRGYTPRGGKRSPRSPVPMSPEDLINLATPKDEIDQGQVDGSRLIDISDEQEQPSTVKKISSHGPRDNSRVRASSRTTSRSGRGQSRDRRAHSPERNGDQPLVGLRGRSETRNGSAARSPSSPVPMSAGPQSQHFYGSDDEEDYRQALEAREMFRRRNTRSSSRGGRDDSLLSPVSARGNKPMWGRETGKRSSTRDGSERSKKPLPTPIPMQLRINNAGDLKTIKDERQLKKEAAARELEERRKSLAQRPSAPPILHPNELSPAPTRTDFNARPSPPGHFELPSTTFVPTYREKDLPSRSVSVDPNAGRSMYAHRNGPQIGLPATPKAMRLVLESDSNRHNVPVPPIPMNFAHNSPPLAANRHSPERTSPKKSEPEADTEAPTLLLPSTVYTPPPSRHAAQLAAQQIPRSMSAPPQDLQPPQGSSFAHLRGMSMNKINPLEGNTMAGGRRPSYDSGAPPMPTRRPSHDSAMSQMPARRPSHDGQIPPPPPPPPAPPMLKELQHLAMPPPPPPAPLPHMGGAKPVVYGGKSGTIEIVMDEDDQLTIPTALPISESTVPIIAPPAPPSSRNGHNRGRSSIDNSIGARISRATDRMRSVSRNRRDTINRTKSPEVSAPYESVPPPPTLTYQMRAEMARSPVYQQMTAQQAQQAQGDYRTGLHHSEMI